MVIQGKARRFGVAILIALALAFVLVVVKDAQAQALPSGCDGLDAGDPMWWFRQCWMYPAK